VQSIIYVFPGRAEGLREFASRRADQFGCASVNQENGELIAAPPLIVCATIPRFGPKSNSSLRSGLWL
jgi:hypothetical protein